jgi:hypothetical protein
MQKKVWLLALAMVGAVLLSGTAGGTDGQFYVISGGGAPVGTKITSLPFTITAPGFYYLTGSITYSGTSDGIMVKSDNVIIDLMGFCLTGPGGGIISAGIRTQFDLEAKNSKNVEVRNGSLTDWHDGFSGFVLGRALNLVVRNCFSGIAVQQGMVKGCIINGGNTGIINPDGVITGNTVSNCNTTGISGRGTISGNCVTNCPKGINGFGTISGNFIEGCTSYGIWLNYGNSPSSIIGNTVVAPVNSTGIYIDSLLNCPTLVTQNAVFGGTPFHPGGSNTVNVNNAGF